MIPFLLALALAQEICPVKHPALTALDHASMQRAVEASFRGLYGRNPTGQPGAGPDDTTYWIAVSDHYGEFSDGICRAGWSAYWEQKLGGAASVSPTLGDAPARFTPDSTPPPAPPPPVVVPPPVPPPLPSVVTCDLSSVETAVANLRADLDAFEMRSDQFYEDARGVYRRTFVWIAKYGGPIVAAIFAGRASK
jgi:hypothetical protein